MNDKDRLYYLLDTYLNNTCTRSEMDELLAWIKRAEYEAVIKQYLSTYREQHPDTAELLGIASSEEENQEWFQQIYTQALAREGVPESKRITKNKPGYFLPYHKLSQWAKVAAILVVTLFLSLFYYSVWQEEPVEEITYEMKAPGQGEKIRFMLPDGTQVHLNSESTLEYPSSFDETNREVHLKGEAYFIVVRDESKPFLVHTGAITTRVLGTSFNIRSYPEDERVNVAVNSGKVSVSDPGLPDDNQQVVLEANQWTDYDRNTRSFSTASGDVTAFTAWKEGVLLYHDKKLVEVAAQLERWYGVAITFRNEDLKHCIIRGEHREETLVNVLKAISFAFDIEYTIDGRHVMLTGEGCS